MTFSVILSTKKITVFSIKKEAPQDLFSNNTSISRLFYRTSKLLMNFCMKASEYSVENGSIMTIS